MLPTSAREGSRRTSRGPAFGLWAAITLWAWQAAPAVGGTSPRLCFDVTDPDGEPLKDVELSLVARDAPIMPLGVTDETGRVCTETRDIRWERAVLFLFCNPSYFCGALLTGQGYGFGDDMTLAPLVVVVEAASRAEG